MHKLSFVCNSLLCLSLFFIPAPAEAQNWLKDLGTAIKKVTKPNPKRRKPNNNTGTELGAIVGGVVGNKISDNGVLGAIVGATIGAVIGNEIANNLNEQQKSKVAGATTNAVVFGQNETWVDPETQKANSVTVVETTRVANPVAVPVDRSKVAVVPQIDLIGELYTVTKTSNVRGGPGTNYDKVGRLVAGNQVNVVGKVTNEPWLMISSNGIASGYVYEPLLNKSHSAIIQKKPLSTVAPSQQTDVVVVAATQECRTVEQSISQVEGDNVTETLKACKGANGWAVEVVPAVATAANTLTQVAVVAPSIAEPALPVPVIPGATVPSIEVVTTSPQPTVNLAQENSRGQLAAEIGDYKIETLLGDSLWCAPHIAIRADYPGGIRPEYINKNGARYPNWDAPPEVSQFAASMKDICPEFRSLLLNHNVGQLGKNYVTKAQQTMHSVLDGFSAYASYQQYETQMPTEDANRCDEMAAFVNDPDKPIGVTGLQDNQFQPSDEALEACINAVLAEPEIRRHRAHLGRVLTFRGDFESAAEEFQTGKSMGSGTSMLYFGILRVEGWGVREDLGAGNFEWRLSKHYGVTPYSNVEAISIASKTVRRNCDAKDACFDFRDYRRANAKKVTVKDGQIIYDE